MSSYLSSPKWLWFSCVCVATENNIWQAFTKDHSSTQMDVSWNFVYWPLEMAVWKVLKNRQNVYLKRYPLTALRINLTCRFYCCEKVKGWCNLKPTVINIIFNNPRLFYSWKFEKWENNWHELPLGIISDRYSLIHQYNLWVLLSWKSQRKTLYEHVVK